MYDKNYENVSIRDVVLYQDSYWEIADVGSTYIELFSLNEDSETVKVHAEGNIPSSMVLYEVKLAASGEELQEELLPLFEVDLEEDMEWVSEVLEKE